MNVVTMDNGHLQCTIKFNPYETYDEDNGQKTSLETINTYIAQLKAIFGDSAVKLDQQGNICTLMIESQYIDVKHHKDFTLLEYKNKMKPQLDGFQIGVIHIHNICDKLLGLTNLTTSGLLNKYLISQLLVSRADLERINEQAPFILPAPEKSSNASVSSPPNSSVKPTDYAKVDFKSIPAFASLDDNERYKELAKDFATALDQVYNTKKKEWPTIEAGRLIRDYITKIKDEQDKKDKIGNQTLIIQLNEVLYRSTLALYQPTNLDNLNQLSLLAGQLPGVRSKWSKSLSIALYSFAALSIIIGITLLASPTAGGSFLMSAASFAHLSTAASAIANVASMAAVGIGHGVTPALVGGLSAVGVGAVVGGINFKVGLFNNAGLSGRVERFHHNQKKDTNAGMLAADLNDGEVETTWRGLK